MFSRVKARKGFLLMALALTVSLARPASAPEREILNSSYDIARRAALPSALWKQWLGRALAWRARHPVDVLVALHDISLTIPDGQLTALLGPSGSVVRM